MFLLMPLYTFARTIQGTVTDEENNPIAFANVIALDNDSTFLEGVVTDSFGTFHFHALPEASAMIRISCVGYEDRIITVSDETELGVIRMKASSTLIHEVVVKANLPATKIIGDALVTTVANSILADARYCKRCLGKSPLGNRF